MPLTPSEAADVAKRHGLSLQDAAGLLTLATDADDADRIAAKFAAPATKEATREFTAALFGRKAATEPEPDDKKKPASADLEARRFVTKLFDPR